jgi:hypothetical protein
MKNQLSKKRNLQIRPSRMKETSSFEGNNTLLSSCTYRVCIISIHILYIYLLEEQMFQEELYLWKNNKIRIAIIIQVRMKYIKENHVEAITRDLEEARQKEVNNQEEIGEKLITLCIREQGCRRKCGLS